MPEPAHATPLTRALDALADAIHAVDTDRRAATLARRAPDLDARLQHARAVLRRHRDRRSQDEAAALDEVIAALNDTAAVLANLWAGVP